MDDNTVVVSGERAGQPDRIESQTDLGGTRLRIPRRMTEPSNGPDVSEREGAGVGGGPTRRTGLNSRERT
jgi:hypothetical protein